MGDSPVLVRIRAYRYLHEAEIAKSVLGSEGIEAFIDNENIGSMDWAYTAADGIGVSVKEEDAERALEILTLESTEEAEAAPEEEEKKEESPHPIRPEGATKFIVVLGAIIILAVILFSIIIGFK
jgi:hypothetical protein